MTTPDQQEMLDDNSQFHVLTELADGELLIAYFFYMPMSHTTEPTGETRIFILTREGPVQEVAFHYRYYHNEDIPAYLCKESPPSSNGPCQLNHSS